VRNTIVSILLFGRQTKDKAEVLAICVNENGTYHHLFYLEFGKLTTDDCVARLFIEIFKIKVNRR